MLLDKELKGKSFAATFYGIPGFITVLKISVVQIIKIVTFNMNPRFKEVTLNSFVIVMYNFCTNPARKIGITDITHEVSFCLLHLDLVNEI